MTAFTIVKSIVEKVGLDKERSEKVFANLKDFKGTLSEPILLTPKEPWYTIISPDLRRQSVEAPRQRRISAYLRF
jgi:hypothetical protein